MAVIQDWVPPTRENYHTILLVFQIVYPLMGLSQIVNAWYGMGKTSVVSRLNIPGRVAWFLMECPGFMTLLYTVKTLPAQVGIEDLPWQNKVLAGLFVIHYTYRAVLFPLLQPSMSPIHLLIMLMAVGFQVLNATCIGSYLGAYGPVTQEAWAAAYWPFGTSQFAVGLVVFYVGLVGTYFHDEELREIRRVEKARQERVLQEQKSAAAADPGSGPRARVDKYYRVPEGMMFRYVLYPHYLFEWIEWFGYWAAMGWGAPARVFLVNELFAMVPRTVSGRKWYEERFGEEKIRKKWTAIPGIY